MKEAGCLAWIVVAISIAWAFMCWPLMLLAPVLLIWAVFFSTVPYCPKCRSQHFVRGG